MMIIVDNRGEEDIDYTDEERAAIVACFPKDMALSTSRFDRLDLIALRDLTWAAQNYVFAWRIAPRKWDIQNIAEERAERLEQIDGTIEVASRIGDTQLVQRLGEVRSTVERKTWTESIRDPRGTLHRNEFLTQVFRVWAHLRQVPIEQCKISANETSPMLRFVRAATDPVFEITGQGIDADMIKRLLAEAKRAH